MQTAALVVAAGTSSHDGEFTPMLNIGSISAAQRIIATLHQVGISKIVMVTGCNATTLERHLSHNGIIFLRNENYETTQMFDSVKIGLQYLKDKCDKILLTPVDVPLFTAQTAKAILDAQASLACPVYNGTQGHPILISNNLLPKLLNDCGDNGLKGAMERCGAAIVNINVDDPGTVFDADAYENFSSLVDQHNSQLIRPVVSVSLNKEKPFFDSKIAMLLMLVDETKSVRAASQRMQLSYSSCWNILRNLESQLNYSLIDRIQGGAGGSTSTLTDRGRLLLERYSAYEQKLKEYSNELYNEFFSGLFD